MKNVLKVWDEGKAENFHFLYQKGKAEKSSCARSHDVKQENAFTMKVLWRARNVKEENFGGIFFNLTRSKVFEEIADHRKTKSSLKSRKSSEGVSSRGNLSHFLSLSILSFRVRNMWKNWHLKESGKFFTQNFFVIIIFIFRCVHPRGHHDELRLDLATRTTSWAILKRKFYYVEHHFGGEFSSFTHISRILQPKDIYVSSRIDVLLHVFPHVRHLFLTIPPPLDSFSVFANNLPTIFTFLCFWFIDRHLSIDIFSFVSSYEFKIGKFMNFHGFSDISINPFFIRSSCSSFHSFPKAHQWTKEIL